MAPPRSRRLGGPALVAGGNSVVLFTVPAGVTYLVRRVVLATAATGVNGQVYLGPVADGNLLVHRNLTNGSSEAFPGDLVFHPGEQMRCYASGGSVTFSAHGMVLQGVSWGA